ncbi:MAG: protoporphyrinogen oxidase, partial [Gaiellales bacterium]
MTLRGAPSDRAAGPSGQPSAGRIIVVGGGVSGLAAARHAQRAAGGRVEVLLLEADARLGGRVTTIRTADGCEVDVGPEALVVYQRGIMDACRELGLEDALLSPVVNETRVFTRGSLRPLPARLMQGAPGQSMAMLRSGVLSLRGFLRAGLDFVLPRTKIREQASIGELVEARIGREAAERLVDPLLGGVHASSIWQLDAQLLAPQVVSALGGTHRSLLRNMRAASKPSTASATAGAASGSPFRTIQGGLQRLIDAMAAAAARDGVTIRTRAAVERVHADGRVQLTGGECINADQVIVAVPSYAAAELLCDAPPSCTDAMHAIDWASTVTCLVRVPTAQASR